jgi:hypothetical protein
MSHHPVRAPRPLANWSEDAQRAVTENPGYFMRWYTLKSLGLVAAVAVAAYYIGKNNA